VLRTPKRVSSCIALRNQGGFTITELLVSVIIVSIGVVGFTSAVGLASTELWLGRRDSEMSMLVADQLEQLKAMGHDAVQPGQRVEGPYRLDWSVVGSSPKKVVMTVEYARPKGGGTKSDTLVAYVPR
jgi:prepilin-type N-terminal cleavage/methylation domain-containing protein